MSLQRGQPAPLPAQRRQHLLLFLVIMMIISTKTTTVAFVATNHRMMGVTGRRCQQESLLRMGLLDFFRDRKDDFVKLNPNDEAYGPGPLLVLYDVPKEILNEEIQDMVADGAPKASKKGVVLHRIRDDNKLDVSLQEALEQIMASDNNNDNDTVSKSQLLPVLFFSGFENTEMVNVYKILGKEIVLETQSPIPPACAKAVPNAMNKPFRQVLEEIVGDHRDAAASSNSG